MQDLLFADRVEAGRQLALKLTPYADRPDVIVLGLPRGGVVVAAEVARALEAPLDVMIVRKLGVPGQAELAMGAIASGGVRILNHEVIAAYGISREAIERETESEWHELQRRERAYRGGRPPLDLGGRIVVVVDDGLATGATMRAAVAAVWALRPTRVVIAVPVAAAQACDILAPLVDEVICLSVPEPFYRHRLVVPGFRPGQ